MDDINTYIAPEIVEQPQVEQPIIDTGIMRTIIVEASILNDVKNLINKAIEGEGEGMFNTPLSATGQEPATHYISSGIIAEEYGAMLPFGETFDINKILELDENLTEEYVNGLISKVNVSDKGAFEYMEELGLQIINTEIE
jgi:hypothetical protein